MTHLILQAPDLDAAKAEQIAAVAAANGLQSLSTTATRLLDVDPATRPEVERLCAELHVDYAYLERVPRLAECKILASDMDSTLINIECIDEIADMAGRKAEVAAITEAAMRGEIKDFSESLRRRVALLRGVPQKALERVYDERLRTNPGAERLIVSAKAAGLKIMLVSGGFTFYTERLKQRLGLDETHANVLEIDQGKLTGRVLGDIVDGQAKAAYLQALAFDTGAAPEQIIAMGDGANDLKMLALAHYSVAYRAKPVVRQQTRYALNYSGLDAVLNWFRG
ncbi:phosphoserine phosphatase SerB [Candidimonas nitroreducens]|uniref:Phosphoserine phosphatase n=1 Tax=Candidimonas nitroreducens TaxID=683354 RepID=A0A225M5T1_9BURK|nr:phosphoserine phosphatase SerB [Candidimonas nitroreducens]OWT56704.1 phosphoserine phosphatase SerB [Candidimonas nitroreducens]